MHNLIPVTILIADRTYRIKIQPEDEEVVRKTVKTINDKIIEFKTQFAGKDMQDYIAMVLVWYATEQSDKSNEELDKDKLATGLQTLERLLDSQLEQGKS